MSAESLDGSAEARRSFLVASITDTEGTIRATDTKASIALVLHGILINGLLTVTRESTAFSPGAAYRAWLIVLAVLVGLALLVSVGWLLRCITPAPQRTLPDDAVETITGLFFPSGATGWFKAIPTLPDFEAALTKYRSLDEDLLLRELAGELFKVSAIRERKSTLIKVGFLALAIEIAAATGYLLLLGLDALR